MIYNHFHLANYIFLDINPTYETNSAKYQMSNGEHNRLTYARRTLVSGLICIECKFYLGLGTEKEKLTNLGRTILGKNIPKDLHNIRHYMHKYF